MRGPKNRVAQCVKLVYPRTITDLFQYFFWEDFEMKKLLGVFVLLVGMAVSAQAAEIDTVCSKTEIREGTRVSTRVYLFRDGSAKVGVAGGGRSVEWGFSSLYRDGRFLKGTTALGDRFMMEVIGPVEGPVPAILMLYLARLTIESSAIEGGALVTEIQCEKRK